MRYGAAVGLATPAHHVLLTRVGDDWPTVQQRMNALRRSMRRRGRVWEDAFHIEANPRGTGHHIHAWHWGSSIEESQLAEVAAAVGMGAHVEVQPRYAAAGTPLTYGMKSVISGSQWGPSRPQQTLDYLAINGNRLGHATPGYWRDMDGRRLGGVKAAIRASRRSTGGPWVLTT